MRRKKTTQREINPDSQYNSALAAKFINKLMQGGKKATAQNIFYTALDLVAKKKKGKSMAEKLSQELMGAFNNTGDAIRKKEETHKIAESNRAFAHFAW